MKLKRLPIGQSSFKNIIADDCLYVDKTQDIYNLITSTQFNFLARPRRFGKSLLISTLEEIFTGNKELFKGLWIYDSDYEWKRYGVIRLDMNAIDASTPKKLEKTLNDFLDDAALLYGVDLKKDLLKTKFEELVVKVYQKAGARVVILIDEYDKPIISHLGAGGERLEIAKSNREILKNFYGTLKAASVIEKLQFVLLTGVSKFSKAGVFSELNNLFDLTMDSKYATMLGITDEEVDRYMKEYIVEYAKEAGLRYQEARNDIREYYNGYRFSDGTKTVYNPFSLVNFLQQRKIKNYWFESGTPTFLVNLIKQNNYYIPQAEDYLADETVFSTYEIDDLDITALLFQTGYLTIKDYEPERTLYRLTYPNYEVKTSFIKILYKSFSANDTTNLYTKLYQYLLQSDMESFIAVMTSIFTSITYDEGVRLNEASFHSLFYLALAAGSVPARSQVLNAMRRIDMLVEIKNKVYIFEFKCNQSAEKALQQIKEKRYHQQFLNTGKELYLVGINFDTEKRNISEYKYEKQ